MGHWGWRPLVVSTFLSVWVAGCNLLSDSAAATQPPSPYPPVTLTVGRTTGATRAGPPAPSLAFATASPVASGPVNAASESNPTLAPTAQIYQVQIGDTALDIALRAGIDLPTLRAANGGQSLSILQIGQEIVIPPPSGSPTQVVSLPTTAPLALSVEPPACYPFGEAQSLCLGRVVNGQSIAAAHIEVRVTALGPDGASVSELLAVEQAVLPPDGWAPYRVQLPFAPDQIRQIIAEVSGADPADAPPAVEVRSPQLEYRAGYAVVNASLANTGAEPVQLARSVVTLHAADGRVLGYRVVPLDARLAPGQQMPLEATIIAIGELGLLPRVNIAVDAAAVP
ncbi:MAG TPA: LysM peptidoglycan-binding domain-containing protein [Candidatus Limnocylindrales bacterium]|nr:LysM peptidoglycan-binding domain-containing protein [Candidatus Limnocylindrales bacterium]